MSEGFELGPFHVPQQSRRDKLRSLEGSCSGLHPLYDPMLTCAAGDAILHPPLASLPPPVKQESFNLMGFAPTAERSELPHFSLSSSTSSPSHHHLVDLPPSLPVNPNTTYICPPQESHNFRNFEQPLLDNNRLLYKPPAPPSFHIPQNSGMMTQGLSLSLSPQTFNRETSVLPDKGMDSYIVIGGDMSRSIGPLGPFTGYAEVLKGSRFLKPAQQLLEEFCDVGQRAYMEGVSAADVEMDRLLDNTVITDDPSGIGSSGDHEEHHRRKTRLVSMLNEVCRGYKYYYQQMQAVVASFESVHGLSKAAPFTPLALKTLSRHFRNLKNAIATQLRSSCKARVEDSSSKDDEPQFRIAEQNLEHQRVAHASSVYEQPHVWRPQRGLPERAVAVLRAWLFEHFLHPYPTDSDKHMLAKQTGLSRNQVSNWFINARVRLWKPMVEEIHSLEMRQTQKAPECSRDQELNKQANTSIMQVLPSHELFQGNTGQNDRQSCAENQHGTELSGLSSNGAQQINFSYDSITTQRNSAVDVGLGHQMGGGNAGVSLTLGLHQSNGACLPESYPLSVAHFGIGGLGASNTSYAGFGGFSGQIRHFDGQLLHDFVG